VSLNVNRLYAISESTAEAVLPALTDELRSLARASNWPDYIIDEFYVDYADGYIEAVYPAEHEGEIDSLEYGEPGTLPNAVLRPFILRSPSTIRQALEHIAAGELFLELGVL
jgi:hypothetical protein